MADEYEPTPSASPSEEGTEADHEDFMQLPHTPTPPLRDMPNMPKMLNLEMDFYDVLKKVSIGKRVTKLEWNDENIYGFLKDGLLKLHFADGTIKDWIISEGDMLGEDWVIVE